MSQVKAALEVDEPRYDEAAKLGADALPHLKKLVTGDDPLLAAKGTFWRASSTPRARATSSPRPRKATRSWSGWPRRARPRTSPSDTAMYEELLVDNDVGVRKAAVKSIGSSDRGDLKPLVQELAQGDTAEPIRELAASTARSLKKPKK
jgi:hypothetical protein